MLLMYEFQASVTSRILTRPGAEEDHATSIQCTGRQRDESTGQAQEILRILHGRLQKD